MIDRLPPQSLDAEQAVLGSILIDADAMLEVASLVTPDDFYKQGNGKIFDAILRLYERNEPYDVVTVSTELDVAGDLDAVGGRTYLTSLSNATPSAVHAKYYAEIVARKATLRSLISAGSKIASIGYEDVPEVDEAIDRAQNALSTVADARRKVGFKPLRPLLHEAYDKVDKAYNNKGEASGIATGIRTLDKMTNGLQNSNLVIIAARPSVGKTSLAMNIAYAAAKDGKTVGIFSLEMSQDELILRLLSSTAGIDSSRLKSGFIQPDDFGKISQAMGTMNDLNMFIDDTATQTVTQVRTQARRLQMESGLDLVVVDYLQLMDSGMRRRDSNRVSEVSEISRGLKVMAKELNVPVIALSQLSRGPENRDGDGKPRLSDLRESGSIEQDADVVIFLWKPKASRDDDHNQLGQIDTEVVNLYLAKARNGPTGETQLMFKKHRTTFYDMDDTVSQPAGQRGYSYDEDFQY
jgi:replicative DNA helicase